MLKKYISRMKSQEPRPPGRSMLYIFKSWLGGFLGIYSVSLFSEYIHFTNYDQLFLIGSFGASAVLLYGAPQVEYAQPRNLVGGHLISALVGITIYKVLPGNAALAGALAVSLSILAMHLTRTVHPPGGATALIAVIGSSQIHDMGYFYVLSPVGTGVIIMLVIALLTNNLSPDPKRHYPVFWY